MYETEGIISFKVHCQTSQVIWQQKLNHRQTGRDTKPIQKMFIQLWQQNRKSHLILLIARKATHNSNMRKNRLRIFPF